MTITNNPPSTATDTTLTALKAEMLTASTKNAYVYLDTEAAANAGFALADLKSWLNTNFPDYDVTLPTWKVKVGKKAIKWTTRDTVPLPAVFYTDDSELIIEKHSYATDKGMYYKVAYGSDAGKYVRHEDVVPVFD